MSGQWGVLRDERFWRYGLGSVAVAILIGTWIANNRPEPVADESAEIPTTMAALDTTGVNPDEPASFGVVWEWSGHAQPFGRVEQVSTDAEGFWVLGSTLTESMGGRLHLFRSVDAKDWTEIPIADGFEKVRMAAYGSTVYLVATAPGTSEGSVQLRISQSDDDGRTWATQDHELAVLEGGASIGNDWVEAVAGPYGVMAFANLQVEIDADDFVPLIYRDELHFIDLTADGVRVVDVVALEAAGEVCDAECEDPYEVPGVIPWEASWTELGVDPETLFFEKLLFASDFQTFEEVEIPAKGRLLALDDGFALLPWDGGVWRTFDGVTWDLGPSPESAPYGRSGVGSFDGGILSVGTFNLMLDHGSAIAFSTLEHLEMAWSASGVDGWQTVDLAALGLELPNQAQIGDIRFGGGNVVILGVTPRRGNEGNNFYHLIIGTGLQDWRVVDLQPLLDKPGQIANPLIGTDRVAITVTGLAGGDSRQLQYTALFQ